MMKRTLSLLLSLAMVFTLATPAFAQAPDSTAIDPPPAVTQDEPSVPEDPSTTPEDATDTPEEITNLPEDTAKLPEDSTELPEELSPVPSEDTVDSEADIQTLAAKPVDAPVIPGYTLVTTTELSADKYYLIVSLDSNGNAYALYADPAKKSANAGGAILNSHAAPGTFVAKLNISKESVTANREITGNPPIEVNDLRFTIQNTGNGVSFRSVNSLYLNVMTRGMLGNKPITFSLTQNETHSFVLKNAENRTLDFNKSGDLKEFVGANNLKGNTNFWGPSGITTTRFPIYLYTQNDQTVDPDATNVVLGKDMYQMFNKQDSNNTWMFDGGSVTQGSVHDLKGARSYVYQFEEYIRWTQASVRDEWLTRHRFVFNVGKNGQTLANSLAKFDERVRELDPRATAYLIGVEDCKAGADGIEAFKTNLKSYIDKSLALRNNTGFAVIQTPYPTVANGELYAEAAREVVNSLNPDVIGRVQLVDHFTASWDSAYVNENGTLTDRGHFELGRQLCDAVYGSTTDYPAESVPSNFPFLSYADTPAQYSKTAAAVTAGKNSLSVTLPKGISNVTYELNTESYTLTGTANGSSFTIADLPAGAASTLTLTTTDGQTRLPVMVGTVKEGEAATQHSFTVNEELANRLKSDEPMTWMFMGDSITHGASHTRGYDSISQLFEKFLRDDLGRTDDLVINTAVSSAATADTVLYLKERLEKYNPDVVFLMLGANCVSERGNYKTNLEKIVNAAQAKGATVILRTPVCRMDNFSAHAAQADMAKQVGAEKNLTVVDQYKVWHDVLTAHPYLAELVFNNALHPNALGHVWMFRMLLEGTGLAQDSSYLYNLTYNLGTTQTNNNQIQPYVKVEGNTATLDTAALAASSSLAFSEVTLTATDKDTAATYSITVEGGKPAVLKDLPAGKTFTYTVSAQQARANNIVNFVCTTEAQVVKPLEIPGYTQVTSSNLEAGKYYMFVSVDQKGNLYAFYPDAEHQKANPGNSISTSVCPSGTFVSQLTVAPDGKTVSAKWLKNDTALDMNKLHFTMSNGNGYTFKGSNDLYLSLGTQMLSSAPTGFTVTANANNAFTIAANGRTLVLNKVGDPSEYKPNTGLTTNFWGPSGPVGLPVYLFTKDDADAPIVVNKDGLNQAITDAEKVKDNTTYTQESRDALKAALQDAIAERNSSTSTVESVLSNTNKLTWAIQGLVPEHLAPDHPTPATGTTQDQPFINGENGGSQTFRIPALITLNNGWLAAAIDARWRDCPDGYGIDTLFSVSKDNGKTWEYSFPNYFNDSVSGRNYSASAFIDPLMIQGNDNTIYLLTDVFPGGKYIVSAEESTGYETIGGKERMVLYTSQSRQNANNYAYYVGDFGTVEADGRAYAPVIAKGDDKMVAAYYVDEHYRLYTGDKKPMYCQQLDTNQYVQQNVFYTRAALHVRNATYLWLVTSKDNGKTWSAPTILNPQVRDKEKLVKFYGVGPGAGLCLEDGTIMLPCYTSGNRSDGFTQKSSFIYKNPGEDTWKRSDEATPDGDWSSESVLVQIDDTTVRHFYRDGHSNLRYTDHVWDEASKTWRVNSAPVDLPDATKTTNNQLSAIRYSKKVNGQDIIMVSTAATGNTDRQNGKIYSFVLNEDKTMRLLSSYEINKPGQYYGYSSLTQKEDGSIGLLYENGKSPQYISISLDKLIPGAVVDGKRNLTVSLYDSYEDTLAPLPSAEELAALDSSIVRAERKEDKVVYIGVSEGTTSFTSNGIVTTIHVESVYPTQPVEMTCQDEYSVSVGPNADIVNSDPSVISAELSPVTISGGQGYTGTNTSYTGSTLPLASALYTFHQDGELYQVVGTGSDGSNIWLNPEGNRGLPSATQAMQIRFIANKDNTFFIQSEAGRYLHFWRNGKNIFDATSSVAGDLAAGSKFLLYRPVKDGEPSSKELPGYVRTTELKDGGQYLIVAEYNDTYYVTRPSTGASPYSHVMRADAALASVETTVANTLILKALTGGNANILVDGTAYLVSAKHQLTRVERVEPTATTEGNILYWHCEICGKNFLDEAGTQPVDDVVLPIPLSPLEPSTPVPNENPDVPTPPEKPSEVPSVKPSEKPSEKPSQPNATTPATGDPAALGLWIGTAVLSGAGIFGISHKRKEEQ